jgi:hypothetical protein
MRWITCGIAAFLLTAQAQASRRPDPAAKDDGPPAVVELLEDGAAAFVAHLGNDGGFEPSRATPDFRDFYSGVCSVRVTPFQRFSSRLPGWRYDIAEKPRSGQYRYVRFAWKRVGGAGIMVQFHNTAGSWNQRYFAGQVSPATAGWGPMLKVAGAAPAEWVVVTRDFFKDFGAMTITGFALTPMDGGTAGLFDHVYLGRTIEDLDRASNAAFGKGPPAEPLGQERLEQLWHQLGDRDVGVAGKAARALVAGRKESVAFVATRLRARPLTADEKHIVKLIGDLDANRFQVRELATRALEKLGEAAVPFLERAARESSSLEARRRATGLLKGRTLEGSGLTTEQARLLRAIRVLEWCGGLAARKALEGAADGPLEGAGLTSEARRALVRMRKLPG